MQMDIHSALKSQYHAALLTLRNTVAQCPAAMWDDPADGPAPFWRVAYHTLFYTHLYLQKDEKSFRRWAQHRAEANLMGGVPWDNFRAPKPCVPYTQAEILEYWQICDSMIDAGVAALDLSAPQCGFPWYKMPTLEHQIVNIRHIQHHAALLSGRLRQRAQIGIDWIGRV
jgi:hypothetical protein